MFAPDAFQLLLFHILPEIIIPVVCNNRRILTKANEEGNSISSALLSKVSNFGQFICVFVSLGQSEPSMVSVSTVI